MTENKLFQLAQVISDISPRHSPTLPLINQRQDRRSLPLRKNACIVCAICFTCSRNYSENCTCEELQPRRGKNLPAGGLDSRAKKLNRNDIDDYEFTINWLQENAHPIYRDASNQVIGLTNQTEVGLCKAHSSTLYRAKKRREKDTPMPPSPPDLLTDTPMENTNNSTHHPSHHHKVGGGLAAKVKELQESSSSSSSSLPPPLPPPSLPDITMIPSTSYKRKRTNNDHPDLDINLPHSSASTPLYSSSSSLISSPPPSSSSSSQHHHHHLHHPHSHHHHPHAHHHTTSISSPPPHFISSQLPPLQPPQPQQQQPISASLSSLSSSLQHQLQLSSKYNPYPSPINSTSSVPPPPLPTSSSSSTSSSNNNNSRYMSQQHTYHHHHHQQQQQSPVSQSQPSPTSSLPPMQPFIQIETVSLKSKPTPSSPSASSNNTIDDDDNNNDSTTTYFIRNLAITDTFTFRQLLDEIDITSPPPGKRIVISDPQSDRVFPLSQPIRSVLPRPTSSHMEFYLGLTDKTSIDWKC